MLQNLKFFVRQYDTTVDNFTLELMREVAVNYCACIVEGRADGLPCLWETQGKFLTPGFGLVQEGRRWCSGIAS